MADRKMQVERGNLAPYIVVNRDAAVAGVFSVDGEKGAVNLEGKYAKISDINSTNSEISKLKPRVDSLESGLKEINIKTDSMIVQQPGMATDKAMSQKATKDFYGSVLFGAGDGSATASGIMNPANTMWWGAHNNNLYAKQSGKNYNVLQIDKNDAVTVMGTLDLKSLGNYTSFKMYRMDDTGVLFQTSPYKDASDGSSSITIVEQDSSNKDVNSWTFAREGTGGTVASRKWVNTFASVNSDVSNRFISPKIGSGFIAHDSGRIGLYNYVANGYSMDISENRAVQFYGSVKSFGQKGTSTDFEASSPDNKRKIGMWSYNSPENGGSGQCLVSAYNNGSWNNVQMQDVGSGKMAVIGGNTSFDSNGFLKRASPIIEVYRYGDFVTNNESNGASVKHIAKGVYKISGVLGLNSDGAWGGSDGGIEIPLDKNKQPRIWIDYSVESDGDVIIKTYHREHLNSPSFAQNKIEGYKDGDPINIPSDTFISVRVQMPENSKWNVKQKEAEEFHKKELDNGKEILNSDD